MRLSHLNHGWLSALALMASLAAQGGPEQQGPTASPAEEAIDVGYQWREFELTDMGFPDHESMGVDGLETAVLGSRLYLAHGRRYALLDLKGRTERPLLPAGGSRPLPATPNGPFYGCLKLRQDAFFFRRGPEIFRLDPSSGTWHLYFSSRRAFSQFEILPKGRVALICPNPRPSLSLPKEAEYLEFVASGRNGEIPLVEIYDRTKPGTPEQILPYPAAVAKTLLLVNGYPLVDRTFALDGKVLLVSSQGGQVFQFDLRTRTLDHLKTPWPNLDDDFLEAAGRACAKPLVEPGVRLLSRFSFPGQMLLYPQDGDQVLFAVAMNPDFEPGYSERRDLWERVSGNRFVPLPKEYSLEEKQAWKWMAFHLYDASTRSFKVLNQKDLSGLRVSLPEHWLTVDGKALPLSVYELPPD